MYGEACSKIREGLLKLLKMRGFTAVGIVEEFGNESVVYEIIDLFNGTALAWTEVR